MTRPERRIRITRGMSAARGPTSPFTRTLERQIEEIMSQVAPRRQAEGEVRRVISILAVSISEYAALCEELEPTEVGSILEIYLQTVVDSIGKFLGTLQNAMGGTVMATWNALYPQPDHALLAVNAALDMVERIDDVNLRLGAGAFPQMSYAAGINTGDALLRSAGLLRRESDAVGDSVNVAEILSHLAPPGSIYIGEGTHVSTDGQIRSELLEITELPGKRLPVRVFRVIGLPL